MTDPTWFGVEAIYSFENFRNTFKDPGISDVTMAYNIIDGFYDKLNNAGYTDNIRWKQDEMIELDFRSDHLGGMDYEWGDNTTLFFVVTHGGTTWEQTHMIFNVNRESFDTFSGQWRFGDSNLQWLAMYSCKTIYHDDFQNKGYSRYEGIFYGLHLILGSHDYMGIGNKHADFGQNFADNILDGDPVSIAWLDAASQKGKGNKGSVLSAEHEMTWNNGFVDWANTTMDTDHFWGTGRVNLDISRKLLYWIGLKWKEDK